MPSSVTLPLGTHPLGSLIGVPSCCPEKLTRRRKPLSADPNGVFPHNHTSPREGPGITRSEGPSLRGAPKSPARYNQAMSPLLRMKEPPSRSMDRSLAPRAGAGSDSVEVLPVSASITRKSPKAYTKLAPVCAGVESGDRAPIDPEARSGAGARRFKMPIAASTTATARTMSMPIRRWRRRRRRRASRNKTWVSSCAVVGAGRWATSVMVTADHRHSGTGRGASWQGLDHLNDIFSPVATMASKVDELSHLSQDGTSSGGPVTVTPRLRVKSSSPSSRSMCKSRSTVFVLTPRTAATSFASGRRSPGPGLSRGDGPADLVRDLVVEGQWFVTDAVDIEHSTIHSRTILANWKEACASMINRPD